MFFADSGANREDSSTKGFTDREKIGDGIFFVHVGEFFAGAVEADLNFIPDKEHVLRIVEFADLGHPTFGRADDATFGLDGFAEDGDGVGSNCCFEGFDISKRNDFESGSERAKVFFVSGFGAEADNGCGSTVEVILKDDDFGFVFFEAFDGVAPFSGKFDAGFDGFGPGVHGADAVEFTEFGKSFEEKSDFGVIESAGDDGDVVELFFESADDVGVEVSVRHGGVSANAVDVFVTSLIPDAGVFAFDNVNRERFIVMGSVGGTHFGGFLIGDCLNHAPKFAFRYLLPHRLGLCADHWIIVRDWRASCEPPWVGGLLFGAGLCGITGGFMEEEPWESCNG